MPKNVSHHTPAARNGCFRAAALVNSRQSQLFKVPTFKEFAGGRLASIHVEDSPQAHRVIVDLGAPLPFHATASGLAYLAFLPTEDIERALKRTLERFSPETVTEPDAVRLLLKETARRGFSINEQGFEMGVISAAAPILAPSGKPVGALAVAAPTARANEARMIEIGQKTVAAATGIAQKYYGAKA